MTQSGDFGATYGPLTGIALFLGIAFAARLEASRIGFSEPAMADRDTSLEERSETTLTGGTRQRRSGGC